ncbi:M16 family metallopeptidase [Flavilitoribacter nigricans]|uniref:Peptidase M16 n=1 Tax=Flavilitoribacter nigricans (strain ATCC 23147 / DSM 23189 / NBRC 102662 / NCIMB 1420 / SS-2) TaxID=1122177 RepID=A0A2D0MYF2_FLAN2|nr:M16 family metallopeptidase [Flavilitoribacter nigricans]PHN00909.1 peptidase M16 [Flavilitoribacter nigricans DSM 23189 = NBRC 102662]
MTRNDQFRAHTGYFILLLLQLFIFQGTAQTAGTPLPMDPTVISGELDNGLKYFIKHNEKPENRAELRLAVHAGSLQEDDDQQGLAHFIEHMAFNGTENFEKNELIDFLELAGTRFGPDLNAYTSFEETVYMLQTRTDSTELLEKGLLILEDWAGGLTLDPEEIDKERGVVISEWRSSLSPDQRLQQKSFPITYKGSRYAERLPIGDPEIIENADYATIGRFYQDWYRPDLMAVIAVGDFDLLWMEEEIRRRFSDLENPGTPREREDYSIPRHEETRFVIATDKENSFTRIQLSIKHPETPVENEQDYRTSIMHSLYNRMLNARLVEIRQQPNPPFTFAYSGYGGDLGDLDNYFLYAFVAEGGVLQGLSSVYTETRRALDHGFVATELERAKAETLRSAEKSFKEQDKTPSGSLASGLVSHFLKDSPFTDAEQRLALIEKLLPTISLEDINAQPREWITETDRTIVVTGPEKEGATLPAEDAILATLDSIEQLKLDPYIDEVSDAPLLDAELGMGEIVGEKKWPDLGVTEWTLSNGIKVVLKPTDFQNDQIRFTAFSPGGNSLYNDQDYFNATNAVAIIDQSGISDFPLSELNKKLAGKNISVGPYIGELNEGLNGSTSPEDVETLFELIYLYFTAPRKDEEVLQSYVTQQKSIMQNILVNPYYYFAAEKTKLKYADHPRRKALPEMSDLESLDIDKIYEIYQDRFADAGDFTFIFVGNFDLESFRPLLLKYLGSLPTQGRWEKWKDVKADMVEGKIEKTWVRGAAPKALVEMVYHDDFEYTAENRYAFTSLASLVRIKLREAMREDKGGVYGVTVRSNVGQYPKPDYSITISFNAEPEEVDELIATAKSEIEKIMENGADATDIKKITETQLQSKIKNLKENGYWLGQLNARYQNDLPLDGIKLEALEEAIATLDSKMLQDAARKYFGTENFMQFVLLPEEEAFEKN